MLCLGFAIKLPCVGLSFAPLNDAQASLTTSSDSPQGSKHGGNLADGGNSNMSATMAIPPAWQHCLVYVLQRYGQLCCDEKLSDQESIQVVTLRRYFYA